jgi:hypothetical protein
MKRNWIAILFALLSSTSYGQVKKVYDEKDNLC